MDEELHSIFLPASAAFYFKRKELLLDLTNNEIRECGMMDTDRGPMKYL